MSEYSDEEEYINEQSNNTIEKIDTSFQELVKNIKQGAYNSIIMKHSEIDDKSQDVELEENYCKYLTKLYEIYKKIFEYEINDTLVQNLKMHMNVVNNTYNIDPLLINKSNELFDYAVHFSKKINSNTIQFSDRIPYLNHMDMQFKIYPYPYNSKNSD
jgi:hypothetical protein